MSWQKAGPGRPPGSVNHVTKVRREFLELIFGRPGSAELKEFCEEMRQQFLDRKSVV